MNVITEKRTLADFLKLPDIDESPAWEFLETVMFQKPMPTLYPSILQKRLIAAIDQVNSPYEAFPELRCNLSNQSVVPDITIINRHHFPAGNSAVEGAPDWMIEIISPHQNTTKLIDKIKICLREGTQLGWLIDPEVEAIMILQPDDRMMLLKKSDRVAVPGDIILELTVEQIFNWLRV